VVDERLTNPAAVRNSRPLADPDAVVDHAAQMLDEVAVEIGRHRADAFRQQYVDARVSGAGSARSKRYCRAGEREANEVATFQKVTRRPN
jgi:hypothetical protein